MTALWQVSAVVIAMLTSFADRPATLGTVAQREAIRRQLLPPSGATLTNLTLPEPPPPAVSDATAQAAQQHDVKEPPAAAAAAVAGEKTAEEPKKDESWWRDRMAKARQAVTKDEAALATAQGRANSLTTEAINVDDPAKQMQLRQQLLTSLAEVERLKAQLDANKKLIADIQTEARRAGIPPGWIR
jgi:hypothetical protein